MHIRAQGSRPSSAFLISLFALGLGLARAETSPLSIHSDGFGLQVSGYTARERAMGSSGMASVTKQGLSIPNPSRTGFHDKTSFTANLETDLDWLQDAATSNRTTTFLIPALGMNFQSRRLGNLGLFYRQKYHRNFSNTPFDSQSPETRSLLAEGGLSEFAATYALAPFSFLSAGVGAHYLLGRERIIERTEFSNAELRDIEDTLLTRSHGWYPSLSLTYRHRLFSLGATGTLGAVLEQEHNRSITDLVSSQKSESEKDLPWSMLLGAAIKLRPNQSLAADFAWEAWEDASSPLINPAWRLGMGYEFQGSGGLYEPYYRKVAYRGGLGVDRLYLEETNQYSLTAGAGLPLGRRGSLLDIALLYGHRGSLENNLWTEDYVKISLSLTGVGVWGQPIRKRK